MDSGNPLIFLLAALTLSLAYVARTSKSRSRSLPPGPKPWPVLGNALQVSLDYLHHTFGEWRQIYGDVIYVSVLRREAIVLNSLTAAQDLLDKRSAMYSDRPRSILIHEMMDFSPNMPLLPYDDEWRRQRRWIHASLMDKAKQDSHRPIQQREVVRMLSGILRTPESFASLIRRYEGGIMLDVAYGRTHAAHDDSYIEFAGQAITRLTEAGSPSASFVDFIPILRHMPTWLPGSAWKREALAVRPLMHDVMRIPYEQTKQALAAGTAGPSFLTTMLEEAAERGCMTPEDERAMKGAASVLYAAGTDTSATVVMTFVLAMVLHPDVCRKAQTEIDRVVGNARLPDFKDRDALPYVECVLRETLRWNAPLPIGIPHQVMAEDHYRGFRIPRNAIVIANLWYMGRDPDVYSEPESFRPERYLDMDASTLDTSDPRRIMFGFGRRICPGRHLADSSIWLAIACMLATLDFGKARDSLGHEVAPAVEFMPGAVSHPKAFVCSLRPRSQKAVALVNSVKT